MTTPTDNQQRIDAAFQQIAEIIRRETHDDASIFRLIAEAIRINPPFAAALSRGIAQVMDDIHQEIDYTEVLVKALRYTLFVPYAEYAHGLDIVCGDPDNAENFAKALDGMGHIDIEHISNAAASLLH